MKRTESSLLVKIVMIGGLGYFLYHLARKNGNTLANNPQGYKVSIDPDLAIDTFLTGIVPPGNMPIVKKTAKALMARWANPYGISQESMVE